MTTAPPCPTAHSRIRPEPDRPSDHPPAHPSRATNDLLGDSHTFPADRALAARWRSDCPEVEQAAQSSRAFLRRAVLHAAHLGMRRFIDLAAGPGTVGAPHEFLDEHPQASVTYVCSDDAQVDLGVARRLDARHAMVLTDPSDPVPAWTRVLLAGRVDPHDPVVLLAVGLAEHLADPVGLRAVLAAWRLVPAGSLLVVSAALTTAADRTDAPERHLAAVVGQAGWEAREPVVRAHRWHTDLDLDLASPPVCLALATGPTGTGP